ncbi:MAG: V-type ATP synthase subunit E family protein [Chloroflexota bacterium]
MSSADIIREVERETALELEALLGAADRRAAAVIDAATAAVHARIEAAIDREEPAVRAEAGKRVNAARSRLNQRRVERSLARTSAVHAAASARLEAIAQGADVQRWSMALEGLAREALDLVGSGAQIRVRRRDAGLVGAVAEATSATLEVVDDEAPAGVVARSDDGRIEVDATIPVRLDRARVRLAETVAARLGIGG